MNIFASIVIGVLLYLLCALISFFAFTQIFGSNRDQAENYVFASLFFPVVWIVYIPIISFYWIVEKAEKYLEAQNEKQGS